MFKLAALGALGYAGYRYYQKNMQNTGSGSQARTARKPDIALAGGPLSSEATVIHDGKPLPH